MDKLCAYCGQTIGMDGNGDIAPCPVKNDTGLWWCDLNCHSAYWRFREWFLTTDYSPSLQHICLASWRAAIQ